jgi:hypothetical protein
LGTAPRRRRGSPRPRASWRRALRTGAGSPTAGFSIAEDFPAPSHAASTTVSETSTADRSNLHDVSSCAGEVRMSQHAQESRRCPIEAPETVSEALCGRNSHRSVVAESDVHEWDTRPRSLRGVGHSKRSRSNQPAPGTPHPALRATFRARGSNDRPRAGDGRKGSGRTSQERFASRNQVTP